MGATAWVPTGTESDNLGNALRILRRRWKWVLGACLLIGVLAGALQSTRPKRYEANALVLFGNVSLANQAAGVDTGSNDPERDAATQVLIVESSSVAKAVKDTLHLPDRAADLASQIEVQAVENANVLEISATDRDPKRASDLANAFAQQYIAFKAQQETTSLQKLIDDTQEQINTLKPNVPADLASQLQRYKLLQGLATGGARLIDTADVPVAPATFSTKKAGVLGAIVGLALGLILAFLLESLDRRMTAIEDFEREYRSRVLTVVPERVFSIRAGAEHVSELEPFRILRSAVDIAAVSRDMNVIMVTSAVPGEGKTTVAVDLAHAMALAGRAVTVVELDLRRPTFARHFNLPDRTGVTTALVGRENATTLTQNPVPSLRQLSVLPAGPLPPNPAELLESASLRDLLLDLRADGRILVLDTPPLLLVADAHVLARHTLVDGCLVVGRSGVTTREQARRARAVLDGLAIEPLGLVLTGVASSEGYYSAEAYAAADVVAS